MEGYSCKVGKGVLKICMGDNYTDATVVFREYVQNAIDAIYQAEALGIISNTDNYVSIDTSLSDVQIMDRGIGVKESEIGPILVDLGNSTKTTSDIGQYGIGRLSGANWCDKIIFETSYKGEPVRSVLTFDAKFARELVNQKNDDDCGDVMDKVTFYTKESEAEDEHYFRVTLVNVKEELRDEETVRNYLSFIAPVPYDDNFYDDCQKKSFLKYPEFKELTLKEKTCKVHLNGKPVVKPYASTIFTKTGELKIAPPTFFKLTDEDYGDLAWGWYSINELAQQMGEDLNYKGLRLRAKNMAVGSQDYLISYFKNPTEANYVVGEVFIMHNGIQPTGSRDGIKSSPEYTEFTIRLKKKLREISVVYNAMSKLGSAALGPIIKAQTSIAESNVELKTADISDEEREKIKKDIKAQKEIIVKAKTEIVGKIKAVDSAENADLIKQLILKHWAKEAQKQASAYNAKVKPGQKIDPVNIDSFVAEAMREDKPEEDKPQKPEGGEKPTGGEDNPKTPVVAKDTDIYRKLGKAEYNLMKKVYQVLNGENRLDEKTKQKIKAKLVKKILAE
ncbi:MAG: hypothetical protein MJZ92_01670 [Paludibacteraceae bacterium]|nr:hypothetical protein [Paludibacteraceae bacterium]